MVTANLIIKKLSRKMDGYTANLLSRIEYFMERAQVMVKEKRFVPINQGEIDSAYQIINDASAYLKKHEAILITGDSKIVGHNLAEKLYEKNSRLFKKLESFFVITRETLKILAEILREVIEKNQEMVRKSNQPAAHKEMRILVLSLKQKFTNLKGLYGQGVKELQDKSVQHEAKLVSKEYNLIWISLSSLFFCTYLLFAVFFGEYLVGWAGMMKVALTLGISFMASYTGTRLFVLSRSDRLHQRIINDSEYIKQNLLPHFS